MARIPYVDPESFPEEKRDLLDSLSDKAEELDERAHNLEGGTLNLYRTLGNNVALLEAFRTFAGEVWGGSDITIQEREFVILGVSHKIDASYEWHQHVRIALDEGISPEEIKAVSSGEYDVLDDRTVALLNYVRSYVVGEVDDATHDALAAHYNDETIVGIGMLASTYLGLARQIEALDVETEVEFVGWDLENL